MVASSPLGPSPTKMNRAALSCNLPLERAILGRLTHALKFMLHSMPVRGALG
jgi:hypothetical protein